MLYMNEKKTNECLGHIENSCKELIKTVYSFSPVGEDLHIVLDDFNTDDDDLKFSLVNLLDRYKDQDQLAWIIHMEMAILFLLACFPEDERERIVQYADYEKVEDDLT